MRESGREKEEERSENPKSEVFGCFFFVAKACNKVSDEEKQFRYVLQLL